MKKLSVNERAKRGIPSLALTEDRVSLSRYEGYDSHGHLWLKNERISMEPEIMAGSYVCLKPIRRNAIMGLNGETYVFAVVRGGDKMVVSGHVIKRHNGFIRVLNPRGEYNDLAEDDIIEAYQALYNLKSI